MDNIVLARLISGQLVVAERTKVGLKYPCIVLFEPTGFGLLDWFLAMSKHEREDSKKVELPESLIMGHPTEPMPEMVSKYTEMRSNIMVPKKKKLITSALRRNLN